MAAVVMRFVGVACIVMAIGGYYSTVSCRAVLKKENFDPTMPHMQTVWIIMSVICLSFYTALLGFGVEFVFLVSNHKMFFLSLLILEVLYFIGIGVSWRIRNELIAMSIGGASGIANVGLVFQAITGFLLWAPILVFWASRHLD